MITLRATHLFGYSVRDLVVGETVEIPPRAAAAICKAGLALPATDADADALKKIGADFPVAPEPPAPAAPAVEVSKPVSKRKERK